MSILVKEKKRKVLRNILISASVSVTAVSPVLTYASMFSTITDKVKSIISQDEDIANDDLKAQAKKIQDNLKKDGIEIVEDREIIALIAYLQRLGTDIKAENKAE